MLNQAFGVIDEGHFSSESAHIRLKMAAVPTLSVAKAKGSIFCTKCSTRIMSQAKKRAQNKVSKSPLLAVAKGFPLHSRVSRARPIKHKKEATKDT